MRHAIEGTTLMVTGVILQQHQTCLWREEQGQFLTVVAVEDEETGQRGHVLYELEVDKRDINHEGFYTDTPALFEKEHPEAHVFQELTALVGGASERSEEIDEILRACWKNDLEYRAGDESAEGYDAQAWGMYPA
jgi:hypothetical protein